MMDIKKWVPWNWFKKEEDRGHSVPVRRSSEPFRRYGDANPVVYLRDEIDRIFDGFFDDWPTLGMQPLRSEMDSGLLKPTLDLSATDKAYRVSVEIPGVDENDVKIELANDILTIRGEKKKEKEEKGKDYYRMERCYGAFQRVLSLPEDADQENIKARFKKGVLTVTMPRRALPRTDVRQIEVRSG